MHIKWTTKLLSELHNITNHIKKYNMEAIFEEIYLTYTKKSKIGDYSMDFLDAPEKPITQSEYQLAFLCHIVNSKRSHFHNPYRCLSDVLGSFLKKEYECGLYKTNNSVSYVVSLLSEIWPGSDQSQLQNTVYTIKRMIPLNIDWTHYGNLYNRCEMVDLSVLPENAGRHILQVLETRRTFYLRLLLVVAEDVVRERVSWIDIHKKVIFATRTGMNMILSLSPVLLALLASCPIQM